LFLGGKVREKMEENGETNTSDSVICKKRLSNEKNPGYYTTRGFC